MKNQAQQDLSNPVVFKKLASELFFLERCTNDHNSALEQLKKKFESVDFKSNFQFKLEFARASNHPDCLCMIDPYQGLPFSEQSMQALVEGVDLVLKDIHEKVSPAIIVAKHLREGSNFFHELEFLLQKEDRTDHEQTLEILTSIMIRNKITIIEQDSHSYVFGHRLAIAKMKLLDFDHSTPWIPSGRVLDEMARNDEYFDLDRPYSSAPLKEYFKKYYGTEYYEKVLINFSAEESSETTHLTPTELEFKVPLSAVNKLVMKSLQTLSQDKGWVFEFAQQRLYEKQESYIQEQVREVLGNLILAITIKEEKTIEQGSTESVEISREDIPVDWSRNLRRLSHDFPDEDTLAVEEKELKELPNPDLGEITTEVQGLLQTLDFSE